MLSPGEVGSRFSEKSVGMQMWGISDCPSALGSFLNSFKHHQMNRGTSLELELELDLTRLFFWNSRGKNITARKNWRALNELKVVNIHIFIIGI